MRIEGKPIPAVAASDLKKGYEVFAAKPKGAIDFDYLAKLCPESDVNGLVRRALVLELMMVVDGGSFFCKVQRERVE